MERREALFLAMAAPLMVLLSSYLGLGGRFFFVAPLDAYHLMLGIWEQSLAADAVFVAGTLAAAGAGYAIARRGSTLLAVGVSAGAHWLTYWASYASLPQTSDLATVDPWSALVFVAMWGIVGIAFSAVVPPLLGRAWLRSEGSAPAPGESDDAEDAPTRA